MKRYKQTAIWLFSSSIPLTRIQLWQIPGAANTISQQWVGVMINCEGHILSMAAPASESRLLLTGAVMWLSGPQGSDPRTKPTEGPTQQNTARRSDAAFKLCCNTHALIHWVVCFYAAPPRVRYNAQLTQQIRSTMLIRVEGTHPFPLSAPLTT